MTARGLTIAAFTALAVAAVALYAAGRAHRLGLAPLGEVVAAARASLPGRLALALGWVWLGWHLLAR
jgi:Family of unknown function (DUF6186)